MCSSWEDRVERMKGGKSPTNVGTPALTEVKRLLQSWAFSLWKVDFERRLRSCCCEALPLAPPTSLYLVPSCGSFLWLLNETPCYLPDWKAEAQAVPSWQLVISLLPELCLWQLQSITIIPFAHIGSSPRPGEGKKKKQICRYAKLKIKK